ncbi:unnamed protein product, partial [Oppiella nova]
MLLTHRQQNKNRFAYPSQIPDYDNIKYPQMIEINDNYIADKFLPTIQWSQKFNVRLVLGEFGISREVLGADLDEDWEAMDYELGDNISTGKVKQNRDSMDYELGDYISTGKVKRTCYKSTLFEIQYNTVENSVIALLNKVPVDTTSDYCFGNYTNGFNGYINNFTALLPMSPNEMDVKFLLFTCNNRDNSQNLTYLSQPNEWTTAGFNFMVGLKSTLVTLWLDLIGWSLGAHVVGFAGKNVTNPNVGHITADDPAGPGFTGQPPENRLAVGDASFVNVIHTNGIPPNGIPGVQGLGDLDALGNIDSYFNGDVLSLFLCSHVRSNYYAIADQSYAQSTGCQPIAYKCDSYDNFMSGCQPIAYKCDSYDNFMSGLCANGSDSRPMELDLNYWDNKSNWDTTDTNNKYYINTGNVLEPGANSCSGQFDIKLSNGNDFKVTLSTGNQIATNGGQGYTTLYTTPQQLPLNTTATINPQLGTNCNINEIDFNFMSNRDPSIRKNSSVTSINTNGRHAIRQYITRWISPNGTVI